MNFPQYYGVVCIAKNKKVNSIIQIDVIIIEKWVAADELALSLPQQRLQLLVYAGNLLFTQLLCKADMLHAINISKYIFCALYDKLLDALVVAVFVLNLYLDLNVRRVTLLICFLGGIIKIRGKYNLSQKG